MAEASDPHVVAAVSRDEGDHFVDHGLVVVRVVACERHDLFECKRSVLVLFTSRQTKHHLLLDSVFLEGLYELLRQVNTSVRFVEPKATWSA